MVDWPAHDYRAWREEQRRLAPSVELDDRLPEPMRLVAGFDAAYAEQGRRGFGALVIIDMLGPNRPTVETVTCEKPVDVPYVPGFLAYRELPLLEACWSQLSEYPDLLVVDGAGLMHPEQLGLASHAGLRLDVPTIGVTKNLFVGTPVTDVQGLGHHAPVLGGDGRMLGYALRSSARSRKPIFVSPGHRVSAPTALRLVLDQCSPLHKLPITTHRAHHAAAASKQAAMLTSLA